MGGGISCLNAMFFPWKGAIRMSRKTYRNRSIFELQQLEIRRFLTTAMVDTNHILQVVGTDSAETIQLNGVSSGTKVTVSGVFVSGTTTLQQFTIGSSSGQFTKINIDAKGGNDNVSFSNNFSYSGGSTVHGGDGADTLTGGKNNDQLFGDN